jgi:antitoxin component YwqK of YwqJK toxin-antitoxin module
MGIVISAIPAGAIMLSIAFFTWVATNNNAFKNYVAGGAAIVALSVFVVGPTLLSWVNSYEWSRPTNSFEEPNPVKPDGTYTIIDEQQSRSPDSPISGSEEVWVGGTMVGYAEQTYWSNGELRVDNRRDVEKHVITYFYESGMKSAEHRAEPRGADPQHTGWWGYWYENGQQKYALNLVNAKREGPQVYWYENGQEMLTGNYLGGLPDGPLSEWDANGKETRLCSGNGVTLNGYCTKEGLFTFWHENGQKKSEGTYLNGLIEGVFTVWHENGQKKSEGTYLKGRKEGVFTYWNEDGNCLRGCQ